MRVKSKIDIWIKIVIWGTLLIMLVSLIYVPQNEKIFGYVVVFPMITFMLWITSVA